MKHPKTVPRNLCFLSMKILLTGATGYIGKRLLPVLVARGFEVVCCVRDRNRFHPPAVIRDKLEIIEVDFLDTATLKSIPSNVDVAFYLMHSMSTSENYAELELTAARNFRLAVGHTRATQVIYLSGIINEQSLSSHLLSRKAVEEELGQGPYHLTTLRAGIIIGSGSASFEIIRDLVEKLPLMIAPRWLNTRCQPIAVSDVISFLMGCIKCPESYDRNFDIGGPDILTYRDMLLGYARVRKLRRRIYTVPVMTPRLSSYWLYFVTSTSFKLARSLVESMKVEVVCRKTDLQDLLDIEPVGYQEALYRTLAAVEENRILSSWKDSLVSGRFDHNISGFFEVPTFGCLTDQRSEKIRDLEKCKDLIWRIGGENGWYFANGLWKLRGFVDKLFGGVGLRRGRTNPVSLSVGDAVDFWRVLYSNREEGRLLLFAEMKLPGEAWLEFKIEDHWLTQTATFRPRGLWGRFYWYAVFPFHGLVFRGLIHKLAGKT
jgi:uncharacterized protein YbjT (DUF2867 family)